MPAGDVILESHLKDNKRKPQHLLVSADQAERRIDNYLLACLKPIPKSRVYQMLRRGEVRVNGGRIKPDYRLQSGDSIRIPPVFEQPPGAETPIPARMIEMIKTCVMHEDERLLVINKPSGLLVHAGSGSAFGVIELLRELYPQKHDLQLAHRLDKETSGCLLVAKNMTVLRRINQALRSGAVHKEYDALLQGRLCKKSLRADSPLQRYRSHQGEGKVRLDAQGKTALSEFETVTVYRNATRVKVRIGTGRTHQIRVHAGALGHPLAGDRKYGDAEFNKKMRELGLRRMFLHAARISVPTLKDGGNYSFSAPLPTALEQVLQRLAG